MPNPTGGKSESIAEIEADLARTRAEMAETVDEIRHRLDIKSRWRARMREIRTSRTVLGIGAAAIALAGTVVVWRRRHA